MIKKIRSKILASIKSRKINVFILFLLSAFIILIFTKLSKEYTNTIVCHIEKVNVPKEKVILNNSDTTISITLKTHGFKWLRYYTETPKIKVDFSKDVYKKDSVLIWAKPKAFIKNTQFDKEVELLNIFPDTLMFQFDVNMVKKVPVKLNSKIEFAQGYNIAKDYILEPDSIEIIGPKVIVSKLNKIETDTLMLSSIKTNIQEQVSLSLPNNNEGLKFSNNKILLKATVEKFTEGVLKIPVNVINVPKGMNLKYFPREINVSYYVSLNDFKSVKSNDFKIVCDYKNITENQSVLIPELTRYPSTIKNIKINQQRIEFIIIE